MAIPFNIVFSGLNAFSGFSKRLNSSVKDTSKLNTKLEKTNKLTRMQQRSTEGAGKAAESMKSKFEGVTNSVPGGDILSDLSDGFKNVGAIIPNLIKGVASFGKVLLGALGPIALITAAFYTLKKIFEFNIGGIATSFSKLMGKLRSMWAKFEVAFRETLQKLAPFIKILVKGVGGALKVIFAGLKNAFTIVKAVLGPIINALSEIGKAINDAFGGDAMKQGGALKAVLNGVAQVVGVLAKVLGFLIKMALKPVIFVIKGIVKGFQVLIGGVKKVIIWMQKLFSGKKQAKGFFGSIIKFLKLVLTPLRLVIKGFQKLFSLIGKSKKDKGVGDPGVRANRPSGSTQNTNNNQRITVVTSQPISGEGARQFEEKLSKNIKKGA